MDRVNFDEIVAEYQAGNEAVVSVVDRAAYYLAIGIVNLINSINPNVIVIGDDLSKLGTQFLDRVKEVVEERTLASVYSSVTIELSSLQYDPVLAGMCGIVVENVFQQPSRLLGKSASR